MRPLPASMGEFQYIIHAASIASPTYYRKDPIGTGRTRTWGGLRNLLEYARGQETIRKAIRGISFLFQLVKSTETRRRRTFPRQELSRGYVSCTPGRGPAMTRPNAMGRRCASISPDSTEATGRDARGRLNQLRTRPENNRPARAAGFCARHFQRTRHCDAFRWVSEAQRSAMWPTRFAATTRFW